MQTEDPEIFFNLGIAQTEQGNHAAAELYFRKALELSPNSLPTLLNLGFALDMQRRHSEALACYESVLSISPENPKARYNRAAHLLRAGNLIDGFADYEARFAAMKDADRRSYPQPRWDGAPLNGHSILVYCEQGLGDAIQFSRYIPLLAQRGGRIILEVQKPLLSLLASLEGVESVILKSEIPPPSDFYIPLLSLPRIFGTTIDTVPSRVPYLAPSEEAVRLWSRKVSSGENRIRIGLAWAGKALPYPERSCPPEFLSQLLDLPETAFYSLQIGETDRYPCPAEYSGKVTDLTCDISDFADTAALIANLDLVITIDTALAHLAGALGKAVWVMLPAMSDWRWMENRDDSPWYPTMKLFRQPSPGDWEPVVRQMVEILRHQISSEEISVSPHKESSEELFARALHSIDNNRHNEAVTILRSLLSTEPDAPAIWFNLGRAYDLAGQLTEARSCFLQALRLKPDTPSIWYALGKTQLKKKNFTEAEAYLLKAHEYMPESADVLFDLGAAQVNLDKIEDAFGCCEKILGIDPGNKLAIYNRAYLRLRNGDYAAGFADFEARLVIEKFRIDQRNYPQPRWDGSPLNGQTILVFGEQGMGDVIQFSRYIPLVAERGGRVVLEVDPPLVPLFSSFPGVFKIVNKSKIPPLTDRYIHLLSLPHIFGTTLETVPRNIPNIVPDPDKVSEWNTLLADWPGFRIGVVWRGSPNNPIDNDRSCPLSALVPLARIPGIRLFSLQVGAGTDEISAQSDAIELIDHTSRFGDLSDTAAFMANLDLVIGVDTAVTHLAGAMGKQVWVMLPHVYDWRWIIGRNDSPWYPTARVFWQERQGDWQAVVARVSHALAQCSKEATIEEGFTDIETCYTLGVKLAEDGDLAGAERCFRWIIARSPELPDPQHSLGVVVHMQERPQEAISHYRNAIAADPDFAQAHYNLANALLQCSRYTEALDAVRSALKCNKEYADAHWLLGMLLLQQGNFIDGWKEYEWRWLAKTFKSRLPGIDRPRWDGSPIPGKTLLIVMEQGRGDMIQFVRYAPMIATMGVTVVVRAVPEMLTILATVEGVSRTVSQNEPMPEFDVYIPAVSLPRVMATTLDTIPGNVPYLWPDLHKVSEWRNILPTDGSCKVGLAWQGSPLHRDDHNRSCPLEEFSPLASLPGISFYSLQLGEGPGQLLKLPRSMKIVDLTDRIRDFSDSAALVANLDLIISVDTATAHLAGALGKQVWTLLPFVPEWRWMLDRDDTPWYPNMRLFRQQSPGDWHSVIQKVKSALASLSENPSTLNQRGIILMQSGDAAQAEQIFAAALAIDPTNAETLCNQGVALDALGRHQDAIDCYARALAVKPDFMQAYFNMGNALLSLFRLDEARVCFEQVIELAPNFVPAILALGEIAKTQRNYSRSKEHFEKAVLLDQSCADAFHGIAEIYQAEESFKEAIHAYQQALRIDPKRINTLNMLGTSYQCLEMPDKAEIYYRRALELNPNHLTAINNLGAVLSAQERYDEAITVFRALLAIDPGYADAHWNLSMALLALGEYEEGWLEYEWRFKKARPVLERNYSKPRWDGSSFKGKTILLHCEQGFGDTIQFARYIPLVAELGGTVIVECQVPALKRLLSPLKGVKNVVVEGSPLPDFDIYFPLLSLPLLFCTTMETIPDQVPYLAPEAGLLQNWQQLMPRSEAFKVGLVWFGRQSLLLNRKRSCPLETFKPLANVPGVEFYSLQVGEGVDQLDQNPDFTIIDLTAHITDFADTAAFITNLDLVITIDTAAAHLAGAIGARTWLLLPYGADWRWLKNRDDSPWYPTMQLFRQPAPGDWSSVMSLVEDALKKRVIKGTESAINKNKSQLEASHHDKKGVPYVPNQRLRIGLAWSGRQDNPLNCKRTCPFSELQPIFDLNNVDFFSLQFDSNPLDKTLSSPLIDLTDNIHDFEDTAGLLLNLDLVISIDTSVAHLSGALGKPTWLLLPHSADWRWGNLAVTPWYSTLKLFRQPDHGDWSSVISEVRSHLAELSGNPSATVTPSIHAINSTHTDEHRRLEKSLATHLQVLAENPDLPDAHLNVGAALTLLGRHKEAERIFRKLLMAEPNNVAGHLNLAYTLLSLGMYPEGWQHFEWRLNRINTDQLPPWPFLQVETIGTHKIGTSLLVHCEQGFGDTIQFARFLTRIAALGYTIIVSCRPQLAALVSSVQGVTTVVEHGNYLPVCDLQTMLLSLTYLLGIRLENIPAETPYLFPRNDKVLEWEKRLSMYY